MSALLDSLADAFQALPREQVEALGLGETRRAALRRSVAEDLPSQRAETWKYTGLRALGARRFVAQAEASALDPALLSAIPAPRMVFVNGQFDAALSSLALVDGLNVAPLSARLGQADGALASRLGRADVSPERVFARLNEALAFDGALVSLAAGLQLAEPLHLVFVSTPASADLALHLRHVIEVGAGASLSLVEHHLGSAPHRHLVNHLVEVQLDEGASLRHARLQDEDAGASLVARSEACLAAGSHYRRLDLELGAALSRHELEVVIEGADARFDSGGAMFADGRRHLDTRLGVRHASGGSACDLLWRGLAKDRARLAFHGGIVIQAGADGSDARLSNKNLLLSEGAEVDSQPVLEIHADEVKAAHGATVGRLDPGALFYLRSRGIPRLQAEGLLTQAFCRQALSAIDDARLEALLSPRLEARLSRLGGEG